MVSELAMHAFGMGIAQILLLQLVAFLSGLARGFSGFGAGLIFMPLASALIGPRLAAPMLLVMDMIGSLPAVPSAWRMAERAPVLVMLTGALAFTPVGMQALLLVDGKVMRWAISVTVFLMLAVLLAGWRSGSPRTGPLLLTGAISGIFTGAAQIGGAPVVSYWLGTDRPAQIARANVMLFFSLISLSGSLIYLTGGLMTLQVVFLATLTAPAYALGVHVGVRCFGLAPAALFRRLSIAMIALSALAGLPIFG